MLDNPFVFSLNDEGFLIPDRTELSGGELYPAAFRLAGRFMTAL